MLEPRKYRKPPLIEVICDFYFDPDPDTEWDPKLLAVFSEKVRQRGYPHDEDVPGRGPSAPRGARQPGIRRRRPKWQWRHRFSSTDGNKTAQVGENLLVVNQLPPWYGWSKFKEETLACLEFYRGIWSANRIAHAGLHYVDMIDVPGDPFFFDDYFNLYPVLPEGIENWSVTNLAMAFEVIGSRPDDVCAITYHQRPSSRPDLNRFRFRWDYISLGGLNSDKSEVGAWLETAHDFVDRAFRSAFTKKCEELFEPED
jgi:uncharacterized protein (TIGR04255 family)